MDTPVALLRASTKGHPERSLVWREMLSRYAVSDVASVVFRCRSGCWGFLDLWRTAAGNQFTDTDAAFLTAVVKPITAALRRCQAETLHRAAAASVRVGPVILVLSPDLDVRAQTLETTEYLRLLVPPDGDRRPVPAGAYNVAAQLLSVEAGVDDHPPTARVHLSGGVWLTLRAARIGSPSRAADQDIAVSIEATGPAERMTLFARACSLSARETEPVQPSHRGIRYQDDRRADVPLGEHRAGPSQIDLRQDRDEQPPHVAGENGRLVRRRRVRRSSLLRAPGRWRVRCSGTRQSLPWECARRCENPPR